MYPCIHSALVLDQNHTYQWWKHFLNSVTVPVGCLHLLWSPSSSQTPVLRHEGGLYSVPSCFCHWYCCKRCRGNRVSFDRVFRNFLIINIHVMWWSGSYLSLQAGDMHCGCNKMTHTEAWGEHRTSSLVIWLYSKGAGPRQDPWTEKRIQTFDFWKTLAWGYATVPKPCFLQQSTRKGVR